MARKRVTKVEEFDVDGLSDRGDNYNPNDDPTADVPLEETEGISEYISQFGPAPLVIKVYKIQPSGLYYCFKGGKEIDEEKVKAYGGGDYELHVYVNGRKRDTCQIRIQETPSNTSQNAPVSIRETTSSATEVELRLMREQLNFLRDMVAGNGPSPRTPMNELVEAVKTLKDLSGNGNSNNIDTLLKGIELAKEFGGGSGDWKTALIDGVKEIAKVAAPTLLQMQASQETMKNPQLPPSPEQMLKSGIQYLKQKAVSNMPVELVVDWIVNNASDAQYQPFIALVMRSDYQQFINLDADLANEPYATWFRTLHSGIRDAFTEGELTDDTIGESGNVRDFESHGVAGKTSSK